jgi:hypothetical protein
LVWRSCDDLRRQLAALIPSIIVVGLIRMKTLAVMMVLIPILVLALVGCASGPSPEQQARDADQQRQAELQQADFRKSLPPVSNPGQGW